mmetsp:Transcript_5771/g.13606  ORF Transcript_5771/g.13606 Transcript_5771/m.13606 type:complete len:499 (+) Transcript_5771:61-1557(+)
MEWWSIPKTAAELGAAANEQAEEKKEILSPQEQAKMKKIRELVKQKLLAAPAFDEDNVDATVDQIMKLPKRQIQALLQNPLPEALMKPKEEEDEDDQEDDTEVSDAGHLEDDSEADITAEDEEVDGEAEETEVDEEVEETEKDDEDSEESEKEDEAVVEETENDGDVEETEKEAENEDDDKSVASATSAASSAKSAAEVSVSSSSSSSSSEAPSTDDGFQKVIAIPTTLDRPRVIAEIQDSEDPSCPICLADSEDRMARGPCGHSFCVPCMERVVNGFGEETRWPPLSVSDSHLDAPTLGRCPICRSNLSLFEITLNKTGELLHPPDKKYYERPDFPLKDGAYHPYRGKIGQLSFHWDWARLKNRTTVNTPFLNIYRSIQSHPERWVLANGQMASKLVFFEPDSCHFHLPSRTFHGKIKWPSRLRGSYEWDVVLGFHSSYRFLSGGRVYMKRDWPNALPESSIQKLEKEQQELAGYPLDGRWTVTWRKKEAPSTGQEW